MDTQEIRKFLEERTYQISNNWHEWQIEYGESFYTAGNEAEVLQAALNHWLEDELGHKWANDTYRAVGRAREEWGLSYGFEDSEWAEIEKAIAWHEALEKENK
jgi:hypothetical protein